MFCYKLFNKHRYNFEGVVGDVSQNQYIEGEMSQGGKKQEELN